MKLETARIRNFRTIDDSLSLYDCTALCGPNSVGKTNVLAAIRLALGAMSDGTDLALNFPHGAKGARLSIQVQMEFSDATAEVAALAKKKTGAAVQLSYKVSRKGIARWQLNDEEVNVGALQSCVTPLYVPPVRDLDTSGAAAFQEVLAAAIRKARGAKSMRPVLQKARTVLRERADVVLSSQRDVASRYLKAIRLEALLDGVSLDELYRSVHLAVRNRTRSTPLAEYGTGHQSAVIVHLFRHIADSTSGYTLLLLEEPDNHLHPQTMRPLAEDIIDISAAHQTILTTHSPIMIDAIGVTNAVPLTLSANGRTEAATTDLSAYSSVEVRRLLQTHNLRATEPLLATRAVVVEGPFDKHVVSALIEARTGRTPDDLGILVVAGNGKGSVVDLSRFVVACGLVPVPVVDYDAAFSDFFPRTRDGITSGDMAAALAGIAAVQAVLDVSHKRGRDARAGLEGVLSELTGARPRPSSFANSHLDQLLTLLNLTGDDRRRITGLVARAMRTQVASLAREYGVICWSDTLENVMLRKPEAVDLVEEIFVNEKVIGSAIGGAHRQRDLAAILKKRAYEPRLLYEIVRQLDEERLFSRTELNYAMGVITDGLLSSR